MKDFVAIDFETANQHRTSVCSVGIVIVRGGEVVEEFYRLVKPYPNFYTRWATDCHGLSAKDTVDALDFPDIWMDIAPQIEGLPLVAHNKTFDEGCLKKCHEHYNIDYPDYEFYCTLKTARKVFPHLKNHQLHTVSAEVGFNMENHHHALADAQACAVIAINIL